MAILRNRLEKKWTVDGIDIAIFITTFESKSLFIDNKNSIGRAISRGDAIITTINSVMPVFVELKLQIRICLRFPSCTYSIKQEIYTHQPSEWLVTFATIHYHVPMIHDL